jgi:hypothetical protein
MRLQFDFQTDNAAFEDHPGEALALIERTLADGDIRAQLTGDCPVAAGGYTRVLLDINGNAVGLVTIDYDAE